jgi:hypothetical protein
MAYWGAGAGSAAAPTIAPGARFWKNDGAVVRQEADGTFTGIDIAPWAGLEEWKDPAAAPAPAQTVTAVTDPAAVNPIPVRSGEKAAPTEGTDWRKIGKKGTLLTPGGLARTLLV